jgi:hypothetical protein
VDAVADMVTEGGVARARRLAGAASAVRVARGAPGAGWRVSGECAAGDGDDGPGGALPCTRTPQSSAAEL